MKWTDDKPKDVGMYWWRDHEDVGIVEVRLSSGKLFASGKYVFDWVESVIGQWSDAHIPPPEEP